MCNRISLDYCTAWMHIFKLLQMPGKSMSQGGRERKEIKIVRSFIGTDLKFLFSLMFFTIALYVCFKLIRLIFDFMTTRTCLSPSLYSSSFFSLPPNTLLILLLMLAHQKFPNLFWNLSFPSPSYATSSVLAGTTVRNSIQPSIWNIFSDNYCHRQNKHAPFCQQGHISLLSAVEQMRRRPKILHQAFISVEFITFQRKIIVYAPVSGNTMLWYPNKRGLVW